MPVFPSVAADAGNDALCTEDAVVGWFSAIFVVEHPPPLRGRDRRPVSLTVTVTLDVPAVVGVPEISPDEELIERPAGRPSAVGERWPEESLAAICRLAAVPLGWLGGREGPPPLPLGRVHFCWAEPVQVSMSSREPVLPPGSVRHRPELGLTSSPLDW